MIRVKPDRCGYTGYTCSGVGGRMGAAFMTTDMVRDTLAGRTSSFTIDGSADYIDNYLNIPVSLRGMVTTTDHILDADVAGVTAPEVSCDDGADATAADLYNALYKDIVDHRMTPGDAVYKLLKSNIPACTRLARYGLSSLPVPESDEYTMDPGILEPMLATSFSPVGLDVPPVNINAVMFVLVQLTKWRIKVDGRLTALSKAIKHIYGIRSLLMAAQKQSICDDFQIRLVSGSPMHWDGSSDIPKYCITGGTVHLNGKDIQVSGQTELDPKFYMYINVIRTGYDDNGIAVLKVEMNTHQDGIYSVGLGGVRVIAVQQQGDVPPYVMFEIVQERCRVDIDLTDTEEEGIPMWDGRKASKVLQTEECPV